MAAIGVALAVLAGLVTAAPADASQRAGATALLPQQLSVNSGSITGLPFFLQAQNTKPNNPPPRTNRENNEDHRRLTGPFIDRLAERIRDIKILCSHIPTIYQVDCLADQYEIIARSLPGGFDFRILRQALFGAARKLAGISQCGTKYSGAGDDCFVDPAVRRIFPRAVSGSKTVRSSRRLKPIKRRKLAAAKAAASVILEETATVLLRSAENSASRRLQYTKIAQAIDSNKVLLRS